MDSKTRNLIITTALSVTVTLSLSYVFINHSYYEVKLTDALVALVVAILPNTLAALITFICIYVFIDKQGLIGERRASISTKGKILKNIEGNWLYTLKSNNFNAYGIFHIEENGDSISISGDVWYPGTKPTAHSRRGTWHSERAWYDSCNEGLTIIYSMEIQQQTESEKKLNLFEYTGILIFHLRGSELHGHITSIVGADKKEGNAVAIKSSSDNLIKAGQIHYGVLQSEFEALFKVDIMQDNIIG